MQDLRSVARLDLLVFTAGVGQPNAAIRERVCHGPAFLGLALNGGAHRADAPIISTASSRVRAVVEPTNEE
jgi:acetate kinase